METPIPKGVEKKLKELYEFADRFTHKDWRFSRITESVYKILRDSGIPIGDRPTKFIVYLNPSNGEPIDERGLFDDPLFPKFIWYEVEARNIYEAEDKAVEKWKSEYSSYSLNINVEISLNGNRSVGVYNTSVSARSLEEAETIAVDKVAHRLKWHGVKLV